MKNLFLQRVLLFAVLFGCGFLKAQLPNTNGLVSYFPMNSNLLDFMGYGSFSPTTTLPPFSDDRLGNANSAVRIPSMWEARQIDLNNHPDLAIGTNNEDFTVAVWVKLPGTGYGSNEFPTAIAIGNVLNLGFSQSGASFVRPRAVIGITNSPGFYNVTNASINLPVNNQWVHLAIVKSGNQYTLYANEMGATTSSFVNILGSSNGTVAYDNNQQHYLSYGYQSSSSSNTQLRGDVDDIFVYNRALTFNEVFDLYNFSYQNVVEPPLNASTTISTICINESTTITCDTVANANYEWTKDGVSLTNNNIYSGVNTNELTISNADSTASGNYRCVASTASNIRFSNFVSINTVDGNLDINNGLVKHFALNNNTKNLLGTDSISLISSSFTEDKFGAANASVRTDSAGGQLIINDPYNGTASTYSMWFYRADNSLQNRVLFAYDYMPVFFTGAANNQLVYVDEFEDFISLYDVIIDTGWHHIAVCRNFGFTDVYLNNTKIISGASIYEDAFSKIGGDLNPANTSIGDKFDDIRIYNRFLNAEEVAILYNIPIVSTYEVDEKEVCDGQTLNLTVVAGGAADYQWFKDGLPLSDGGNISGANTSTLSIDNFDSNTDDGDYYLSLSNQCYNVETYTSQVVGANSITIDIQSQDGFNLFVDDIFDDYEWFNVNDPSNILSTSATLNTTEDGDYQVNAFSNDGCSGVSNIFTVVGTSAISVSVFDNINIYPNPAKDNFFIENAPLGAYVRILDITGKLIESSIVINNTVIVNTEIMSEGLYFIHIETNNNVKVEKLVITK